MSKIDKFTFPLFPDQEIEDFVHWPQLIVPHYWTFYRDLLIICLGCLVYFFYFKVLLVWAGGERARYEGIWNHRPERFEMFYYGYDSHEIHLEYYGLAKGLYIYNLRKEKLAKDRDYYRFYAYSRKHNLGFRQEYT